MVKVLFVCLGNICRSPMAEFLFKNIIKEKKLENKFQINSCATSNEEVGNDIHIGSKTKLREMNIPFESRKAVQITENDYKNYDYILCMDENNIKNLMEKFDHDPDKKISLLLDFSSKPRNIADPWFTGNFDITYSDVLEGCQSFISYIEKLNL